MGDGTEVVVELLEGQGVAGGFEVGGAEEVGGLGVGEGDVPTGLRVLLPVFVVLGVVGGDRVGDEPVDDDRAAGTTVSDLFVDPDRGGLGEPVGLAGDPAGLPGRHLQPADSFPEHGEAVAEVEGVGDQLCPGGWGHAQRQRERFGGERRHGRCAVTAERLVGEEGRPAERLDAGVGGGGVEVGPVRGQLELAERGPSFGLFGCGGGFEHTGGVEVADLVLARGPWCSWDQVKHRPPTLEAENPLYPQGILAS